jgi:Protein of unknown function (DUF1203)
MSESGEERSSPRATLHRIEISFIDAMNYRISGLPIENFNDVLNASNEALRERGIVIQTASEANAYPCRITLEDATVGEEMLLLNYGHLIANSPYASSGPIYIRRNAKQTNAIENRIPEQQQRRLLSIRAYDRRDFIIDAEVAPGTELGSQIERFFSNLEVKYLHVHNARRGCYACRVDRANA